MKKSSERSTVYHVALTDSAKADVNAIYEWIADAAPFGGSEWFDELVACLRSLDRLPYRCPLAREARKAKREIRCLLFGKRRNVYRILYEVDDVKRAVWILHVRHGARKDLKARDVADPGGTISRRNRTRRTELN